MIFTGSKDWAIVRQFLCVFFYYTLFLISAIEGSLLTNLWKVKNNSKVNQVNKASSKPSRSSTSADFLANIAGWNQSNTPIFKLESLRD